MLKVSKMRLDLVYATLDINYLPVKDNLSGMKIDDEVPTDIPPSDSGPYVTPDGET